MDSGCWVASGVVIGCGLQRRRHYDDYTDDLADDDDRDNDQTHHYSANDDGTNDDEAGEYYSDRTPAACKSSGSFVADHVHGLSCNWGRWGAQVPCGPGGSGSYFVHRCDLQGLSQVVDRIAVALALDAMRPSVS